MNKDLYQHFAPEDRDFIDRSIDLFQRVEDTYSFETSSFVNPHQAAILQSLAGRFDLQVFISSDYFPSELVKVLVAPSYYELDLADFGISLLELSYASKFHQLSHSQILGSLLHQLGVERRTFGDIVIGQGRAQIFVEDRLATFFMDHLRKVGKVPVRLKPVELSQLLRESRQVQTRDILASSLRLDKLIASAFKLSRSQAHQLISGRLVKVNYAVTDNPSQQIGLDDLISVRRFGRFKVLKENGLSKNGKHKLTIELVASK